MERDRDHREQRVLILTPTSKDAALTVRILKNANVECLSCSGLDEVCRELDLGAAAVLLAEEAVTSGRSGEMVKWLQRQPAWSDLPLLVLARAGADSAAVARAMDQLGNVTVLERPTRVTALVSSVRTALRSRQRQYQARENLAQIARSEGELRDFFDNASVGLHWAGPDGTILRVNQAELDLLGYERHEYVGRHIAEFHVDASVIEEILRRLADGETIPEREARLRCKDGSIKYVLISSNVLWEAGKFIHTRCFTRDITDRKRAEKAELESETEMRRLSELNQATVANMAEGVYTVDSQGLLTDLNPEGERLFGWKKEELLGRRMHDVTHHHHKKG